MKMIARWPFAATVLLIAFGPAQAQEIKVDEPRVCLNCHEDFAQTLKSQHVHSPAKSGKCSQCHNPHASQHAALLAQNKEEQCFTCHAREKLNLDRPEVHDPAAKGECLQCHDAHASAFTDQLKAPEKDLCGQCHTQVAGWLSSSVKHSPVASGKCTTCHEAHGGDHPGLVRKDNYSLCTGCHQTDAQFTALHKGSDLKGVDCTACHDPHGSKSPGLLMPLKHAPFAENRCQACHAEAKTAGGGYPLKGAVNDLCLGCHPGIREYAGMAHQHLPLNQYDCTTCHNAHAAGEPSLLRTEASALCLGCHTSPAGLGADFRNSLHKEVACATCHAPHGSPNARLMQADVISLCGSCHQHQHSVTHPMGAATLDPRNGAPMDCASCHQIHLAKYDPLLPKDGARELCVECHKNK